VVGLPARHSGAAVWKETETITLMSISFIYPASLWLLLLVPLTALLAWFGPRRPTRARFWGGLALRAFLLTLVVLALAGVQLRLRADTLTAVFVLDVSDSMDADAQKAGENFIREAIQSMPPTDRAAVVVFGEEALVERLATEDGTLPGIASIPLTTRTDIASALQLALALFPDEGAKRMVLLSDGRENLGRALDQAELAAAHDIQLTYVSLPVEEGEVEVLVEALLAPGEVRQGQAFDLTVVIHSSERIGATLRVLADGTLIHARNVQLTEGNNRFTIPIEAEHAGFRRFRAQIIPDDDTRLQNNEASAFTVIHGPPHVLIVEGRPGEGENLADALRAAQAEVTLLPPERMPTTLPELASYEAVVLANVPALALPPGVMDTLPIYVHDLGKGLVMTGGDQSFGAGGYLRTPLEKALPVYMDVRTKEEMANLALVMAIDSSGSMGRCHCDDPDLNQTYTRQEVGQPKVDIAKEAIMRAASALSEEDYMGVVTFDDQAHWQLEISPLLDYVKLESSIGGIQAFGPTNIRSGVEAAAAAIQAVDARRKHIILMTDGWVHEGELIKLVGEMNDQGITLSVVAAGGGSAEYLSELATAGGGAFYPAVDILRVPDFFLKETVQAVGRYIIEEPFFPLPAVPSPVLQGLDTTTLPILLGYNGTTPKTTARMDLLTPRGDPLLATWQYGLGRAAVWTSDLKGQWGTRWIGWDSFPRFSSQLVGWLLPSPQIEGLTTQAELEDGKAVIRLEALDEFGRPRNFLSAQATVIDPDLNPVASTLTQVGPGVYEAQVDAVQPGSYLIRLGVSEGDQSLGQGTLGLVVPYSPEYRASGVQTSLLDELAAITGGGRVGDVMEVFEKNIPSADFAREIWRPLLLAVALLFPLDVAVRRVMLGSSDFRKAGQWLSERLPSRSTRPASGERTLNELFQARDRARQRRRQSDSHQQPLTSANQSSPGHPSSSEDKPASVPDQTSPESGTDQEDTFGRLRRAKKRARKD
jgi:uncharacterized membrane protein/Mg-chelatase subunit ChlD